MPETAPDVNGWGGGDPDLVTAWTLVRAHHAVGRVFHAALEPYRLSAPQFGVLIEVARVPGQNQSALARRVVATPQSIGELLRSMEEAGLVLREPGAGPGRPIAVTLSVRGRELLEAVTPVALAAISPDALGLGESGARRLNQDLHVVLAALTD